MKKITLSIVGLFLFAAAWAADFTPGNLVVLRVGDGSSTLSNASTAIFLDEYTTDGTLVQSVDIPTSGENLLTNSGSATSEGQLTLSPDQSLLALAGYNVEPGTTGVASTDAATVNRKIISVDYTGTVKNALLSATAYNGNNIRGAVTNGVDFWASGTATTVAAGGVQYFGTGTPTQVSSTSTNIRVINIFNGQLYYSSSAKTGYGIFAVGEGMPIVSGITSTLIINMPQVSSTNASPYAFSFNATSTVAYIADDNSTSKGGGIQKWTFSDGNWSKAYTLGATGFRGLTVDWSATNPKIFATGTDNNLYSVTDDGSGTSTPNIIASGATNTAIRGVAFVPIRKTESHVVTPIIASMKILNNEISFDVLPQSDIQIYSITGSRIASYLPAKVIELNLTKGIYIIKVENQSAKIVLK
ncbi:MAG TPA: hypothetical protein PLZ54_09275 [Paludibacteraceae bacterium]|nr:hypothetical protein [Paludibacteraceae bacterium]